MDPVPIQSMVTLFSTTRTTNTLLIIAIILLVLLSAIFSVAETAYTSANRIRLRNLEGNGSKTAKKVLNQLENYDRLISTILIGNNIVNITATSLSAILFSSLIKSTSIATLVSTVVMTLVVLTFGELVPKSFAKENAESSALKLQPILSFFIILLLPFSWFFGLWRKIVRHKKTVSYTGDELKTIVEEAESEGELDKHESLLIRSAIEFDDVDVYDIMIPRVDVIAAEDTATSEELSSLFLTHQFSRLPIYHDSMDSVLGVLHEKDFYKLLREGSSDILSAVKPNICLSRNMKISDALRTLQKAKTHLAVVVDEFGGTSGIVTMEDILEELVGEIYDEHDEVEILCRKENESTYIVSGAENLEDLFERLSLKGHDEFESSTIGGFTTELFRKIPVVGEEIVYNNAKITVTKATAKKVLEVRIELLEKPEEKEEE